MRLKKLMTTALLVGALGGVSACTGTPPVGEGPAEVSVEKTPLPVADGGQEELSRLDKDRVPGANVLEWGGADEHTWLPESESVLRGLGDSTAQSGSLYLRVPASYEVTAAALASNQVATASVDVTTTTSKDPLGTVVDVTTPDVYYVLSASPDTDGREGFSIVLVQWAPVPAQSPSPASVPTPTGTPTFVPVVPAEE